MKIEDYGIIGDTQTVALVGRNGSIDWLCFPRFDSAACFAALLGKEEHGCWKIAPAEDEEVIATRRAYRDGTLILETEFETADGCVRLVDAMPIRERDADIVRIVEGVRGTVRMKMLLIVRFDYGSIVPWTRHVDDRLEAVAGPDALSLWSDVETHGEGLTTVAEFEIGEGESVAFDLLWHASHQPPDKRGNTQQKIKETEQWWLDWLADAQCGGEWCKEIERSLVTLKALTYAPTGGIVAAATTSLPEFIGGVRNWDYRLCWLRDATFMLYTLMQGGHTCEARDWRDWLLRAVAGDPGKLQIMYGLAGERRLEEYELPWLPGYEGSTPVRVGNAAYSQFQLDVYGEVIDSMHQARCAGINSAPQSWAMERAILKFLETAWKEPDEGIWEVRGPRRHFTHSKLMAWVAFDRAVQAVESFGLEGPADEWKQHRDALHREICERGYNKEKQSFVQVYDGDAIDASLLMVPLVGFLPPEDERVQGTIAAVERELLVEGYVLRYLSEECSHVDGLPPGEGAFLLCSFWLADNYAMCGRLMEARALFERLLKVRNDLGLLAEQVDPRTGRMLGNFPQAFSHVGLINTARNLSKEGGPAHQRPKAGK
ncbi:GH15 family glucan-1,4-alpha-glucosidase [Roseimicrobium gellanilyticum]|uniref:Trehalase n=1 Tax=Roseimicrobium gellanilyticum TaxID=748857 RepID=A0A366H2M9_9BACT|nr:glycoside hydrolase family 15 protein [Roseimicrobium gellanilyticum]RBP35509.1 GH15 family glucan-1,4-alpha-glucosidase [Roseimicrobium gellanilyticum]